MIRLNNNELALLKDKGIFDLKRSLAGKISNLFGECSSLLENFYTEHPELLPEPVRSCRPKISKGENYLGYPWTVLDYPRYFSGKDIYAFRTLCWWGNGFSMTFHAGGRFAEMIGPVICSNAAEIPLSSFFLAINSDPWQHHFGKENFHMPETPQEAEAIIEKTISEFGYFKIMRRAAMDEWEKLPGICLETAKTISYLTRL